MTQAASQNPGTIRFSVPDDVPGVATVIQLHGNLQPSCYLNTYYTFKLIRQSASVLQFRGKNYDAPGPARTSVCLLDPGEMLRTSNIRLPEHIDGVMIQPGFLAQFAEEIGLSASSLWFRKTMMPDPQLIHSLEQLVTSLNQPSTSLERQTRFAQMLRIAMSSCMEAQAKYIAYRNVPAAILRVKDWIHEHFTEEITLDELIAISGLSRSHLLRAFTRSVGVPPHRFQIHLRIAHARDLLARKEPLASVAAKVGFYDQSHFGRHFRQIIGVTPKQYIVD